MRILSFFAVVLAAWLLMPGTEAAHAGEKAPFVPRAEGTTASFVVLESDTVMECDDLGGAAYQGTYISGEAAVQFACNRGVILNYSLPGCLGRGEQTLPTRLQIGLLGAGTINGYNFNSPLAYTPYGELPDEAAGSPPGAIYFLPGAAPSGVRWRLLVTRSGLDDAAGEYTTSLMLQWSMLDGGG